MRGGLHHGRRRRLAPGPDPEAAGIYRRPGKLNARTSSRSWNGLWRPDNGDLFITLTYDDTHLPEDREAAIRRIRSFLSKLRKARKPRGQLLHYIYVTEGGCPGGRLHHHLVVNSTGEDLEEIRRLWIYGDNVEVRRLEFNQGHTYEDLASYLTKEPREWGHPQVGERTWTPSLGLARTEPGDGDRPGLCDADGSARGRDPAK